MTSGVWMILRGCGCVCSCRLPSGRQWASGLSLLLPAMRCVLSAAAHGCSGRPPATPAPMSKKRPGPDVSTPVAAATSGRVPGDPPVPLTSLLRGLKLAPPDVLPHAGEVGRAGARARHRALHVDLAVGGARCDAENGAPATARRAELMLRAVRRGAHRRGGLSSKAWSGGIVVNFCPGQSVEAPYVPTPRAGVRLAGSVRTVARPALTVRRPPVHRHDGGARCDGLLLVERAPLTVYLVSAPRPPCRPYVGDNRRHRDRRSHFSATGLYKRYGDVVAVDGLSLSVPARRVLRPARPERRRQDHDHRDPRRAARARRRRRGGARAALGHATSTRSGSGWASSCRKRSSPTS